MTPDIVLVGGGLANGLLAYRLRLTRPELRLLLLEQAATIGGDHTWSFHETDLSPAQNAWIAPFVVHAWPGYRVAFPGFSRDLAIGYRAISADRFRAVLTPLLGDALVTGAAVTEVGLHHVTLADGRRIEAASVVDGRGFCACPCQVDRFQVFFGQEVRLAAPHGLDRPVLMDATVAQEGAFRFVYVLPFAPDVLLIEDTYYADAPGLDAPALRARIAAYAAQQGWEVTAVLREEQGVLPITLSGDMRAFWRDPARAQAAVGMRAGLFHPTTGYSLPDAVRLADAIAAVPHPTTEALATLAWGYARAAWRERGLFRLLNRLLFLAGPAQDRYKMMRRFYGMSERLIARFYAGALRPQDKLRILVGRPPVSFAGAVRALVASGR